MGVFKYNRYDKRKGKARKSKNSKRKNVRVMRSLSRVQGVPNFLPKQQTMKLSYVSNTILTSAAGLLANYQFRANGLHDPDITSTGHQPYGWDQLKEYYNHYVVLGSKITVHAVPQTDNAVNAGVLGVYLSDDTSHGFTSYTTFIEAGKGTWSLMNGGSNEAKRLTCNFSAKKYFNVDDVKDNLDRLGAATTTDPNEIAVYNCWYQVSDEGSTGTNVALVFKIDYIVSFSEPKDITPS